MSEIDPQSSFFCLLCDQWYDADPRSVNTEFDFHLETIHKLDTQSLNGKATYKDTIEFKQRMLEEKKYD